MLACTTTFGASRVRGFELPIPAGVQALTDGCRRGATVPDAGQPGMHPPGARLHLARSPCTPNVIVSCGGRLRTAGAMLPHTSRRPKAPSPCGPTGCREAPEPARWSPASLVVAAGGGPLDEPGGDGLDPRGGTALDRREQPRRGAAAELLEVHVDARELGPGVGDQRLPVVVARDRDVLGDPHAVLAQDVERPAGDLVAAADDGVDVGVRGNDRLHRRPPPGLVPRAVAGLPAEGLQAGGG